MNNLKRHLPPSWRRNFGAVYRRFFPVASDMLPPDLDADVLATWEAVKPFTMTSLERIVAVCDAAQYIARHHIPGDIVECGVWRGGSTLAALRTLIQVDDVARDVYMFDTFEGMPEPSQHDRAVSEHLAADLLDKEEKDEDSVLWAYAPLESVKATVGQAGYPANKLHFIQGRVEETLPTHTPDQIALLRLDTDWYESTRAEMAHLFPRLVVGGVIIIDDYGHWEGARRAVDEYLSEHSVRLMLQRIDYTGRMAVKQ